MPFLFRAKLIGLITLFWAVFIFGFGSGVLFYMTQLPPVPIGGVVNQELDRPGNVDFSLFWDAWRVLQEKYPQTLNPQEMVYGAISGMVKSLGDPYTVFLAPDQAEIFNADMEGEFEGVGMEIGIKKERLQIIAPLENTPAQRAGLRSGDKIIKIDDKETFDMALDEAVMLIRGAKGSQVKLTVFRSSWEEPKEFTIVRDVIKVPSLSWELKDGSIAYVKLYQFSQKAGEDFVQAAQEIINSPAQAIILDLRDNPGGYLEIAQDLAGWFLPRGQMVTIEESAKGDRKEYKAQGPASLAPYPIVAIINQGTASASEILVGALRDNRGVKLIGETSFGKGSVQEMQKLKGGSFLKVTVANWLTPNGELIAQKGLEPDVKVEWSDEDFDSGKDPQLEKALEMARNLR